jgi:eukaryotic-like serine/threonine-protein kinase
MMDLFADGPSSVGLGRLWEPDVMSNGVLRCAKGHEWEAVLEAGDSARSVPCPICGSQGMSIPSTIFTPPSLPGVRPPSPLSSPMPILEVDNGPQTIPPLPDYEIVRELGKGGMGVVYLARHSDGVSLAAVKVIRRERLSNPEAVSRFRREAQAAARLSHPNIVTVLHADQHASPGFGEIYYLVMEYVSGITLQKLVDEEGPLPVALACDFVRQISLGLQHAADRGLVHRDIKPSNLMVVAPKGLPLPARPVVKLLDMGVARLSPVRNLHEETLTTLTRDGAVIGTPDYIAPEQLEKPREADIRADLYSLGCTFYFLLSGQVPFPGGTLVDKLDWHRWKTAPSVDQVRREVPAPVARLVRRLMAKHPDDRFDTPGELATTLRQLLDNGEVPAPLQALAAEEIARLPGHEGSVLDLTFSHDGRTLASVGTDRTLRVWDVATQTERLRLGDGKHEMSCIATLPTVSHVLAGHGVAVRLWDLSSGQEIRRFTGHSDAVRCLAVSRDGRQAVTGSDDRTVRLWDLQSGREVQRLPRHGAGVSGVALSPDGRYILTGSHDQTLQLWDASSGRLVRKFDTPRGPVLCVGFSPEGRSVLSGHFDTTLRLWDVGTGREERRFTGHRQMVGGLAFASDGTALSASHDHTVRAWDPASGAELFTCPGHTGPVCCIAVGPGDQLLASGGFDRAIRLWKMPG